MQKCRIMFYNSVQMSSGELVMTSSGYQKSKNFLLGYIHTSLSIGAFSPIGVACRGQAIGDFCHQVTELFRQEEAWVRGCSGQCSPVLAALLAAWHGGCTGTAFVTWLISLCLLVLSTNFPSTRQYAVECWFCQSYKYLVYNETNIIEAFQVLNFALPDLIFAFCFRPWGPYWVRIKPSALHDIPLEVMSVSLSVLHSSKWKEPHICCKVLCARWAPAEGRAMARRSGELCIRNEISSEWLESRFKIKMNKKH